MNTNHIQQGDVIFKRAFALPSECRRLDKLTVALGEHTGHHHSFEDGVALFEAVDKTIFAVNETDHPVRLTHQEHNPVVIEPGAVFEFGQVREKDWFTEMIRPVID